jgi:hypothetical protein
MPEKLSGLGFIVPCPRQSLTYKTQHMKKIYIFLLMLCAPFVVKAGCGVNFQATNVTCYGACDGSATAIPSGAGPYTFLWFPGGQTTQTVNGLCAGTYTVTVIDGSSCQATGVVTITQPTQLVVATSATNPSCSSCCDGFIISTVQGGTPAYTYMWAPIGQTSSTAQGLCQGTYTLCVTDVNGCTTCVADSLSFSTGIHAEQVSGNLVVFPVPAMNSITVQEIFGAPVASVISISNVLGETVYTKSISSSAALNETINIENLTKGVYFISIRTASGNTVKRFIKE